MNASGLRCLCYRLLGDRRFALCLVLSGWALRHRDRWQRLCGDGEELGGCLADGLVELAGLLVGLRGGEQGRECFGGDVEREEFGACLRERVGGRVETLEERALEKLGELMERERVTLADGDRVDRGIEQIVEQGVGVDGVFVRVHAGIFARGERVAKKKRCMSRILRTDPVTVVQIFEFEDREGLEGGEEERGTRRWRRTRRTQRRS